MFGLTANMSLTEVKAAVISKASAGGFLSPIISFLKDMSLEWADVPTALATQRDGKPVIMLGRAFFAKHVKNESEAADVVLHEIMHHVFLHLARSEHYTALGYSFHLQNLAMDAIINAYLARFNCAGFMERFYKDVGEYSFLRPNSDVFGVSVNWILFQKVRPLKKVDEEKYEIFRQFYFRLYQLQITLEDALIFFAKYFPDAKQSKPLLGNHSQSQGKQSQNQNGQGQGQSDQKPGQSDGKNSASSAGGSSNNSGNEEKPQSAAGSAGSASPGDGQDKNPGQQSNGAAAGQAASQNGNADQSAEEGAGPSNQPDPGEKPEDKTEPTAKQDKADSKPENQEQNKGEAGVAPENSSKPENKPENKPPVEPQKKPADPLINPLQIAEVFKTMAAQAASRQARNNFDKVIKKILENSDKPGLNKDEWQLSRRVPAKLNRRDTVNVERGKELFTRNQHVQKEVWLLPDVSASMTRYLPFVVGLIKTLKRRDIQVRVACWSERIREVPIEEMFKNQLPMGLGFGTNGEALARFMNQEGIKEAVIITDNEAGMIYTPIKGFVHLCLVEDSRQNGSFLNPKTVPRIETYQLKLREDR